MSVQTKYDYGQFPAERALLTEAPEGEPRLTPSSSNSFSEYMLEMLGDDDLKGLSPAVQARAREFCIQLIQHFGPVKGLKGAIFGDVEEDTAELIVVDRQREVQLTLMVGKDSASAWMQGNVSTRKFDDLKPDQVHITAAYFQIV